VVHIPIKKGKNGGGIERKHGTEAITSSAGQTSNPVAPYLVPESGGEALPLWRCCLIPHGLLVRLALLSSADISDSRHF
jgi:hypothetical protein